MTLQEPAAGDAPAHSEPVGRRERKKLETRARLHRAAIELFARQGYHETRIAEIAEAADVSESTFFRYFESKAGVALEGMRRHAEAAIDAVRARPAHESPVEACLAVSLSPRSAGLTPTTEEATGFALLGNIPELAPRAMALGEKMVNELAEDVARRLGEPPGSVRVRMQAHALNMVGVAAMEVWLTDPTRLDPQALSREALLELQRGL